MSDVESRDVESQVEALLASGDLPAAAAIVLDAGDAQRAAVLYERACDFESAARAAIVAGEPREAVRLAVLGNDDALCERAVDVLVGAGDDERSRRVATDLVARAYHRHGARIFQAVGDHDHAAEAYERAGLALAATKAFDAAGRPADAARVLEAAIRGGHEEDVDRLRVALGTLYARHGKHQAAVRVLQRLDASSEHRRKALGVLVGSLEALGLRQALADLEGELARRGIDRHAPQPATPSDSGGATMLFGRYRVEREVASTAHARLLLAQDTLRGEPVALKILASKGMGTGRDALARFVREAKALARLRHPSVVPMRAFIEEGPAIVLAWMGGGSLADLLAKEAISPARALEIVRAVLDALAEAHRLGVLHRDIKPANVLFDEGGAARLADFGAAHLAASEATVTVGAIGTAAYMAPEQRAGRAASVQSDLYGVGVMLFEMICGHLPGRGVSTRVSEAHPDLGEPHDALLARLMAPEPDDRPAGALAARRALEALAWSPRRFDRAQATGPSPLAAMEDGERLVPARGAGDAHDSWLGRDVVRRPLDEATLAHAGAFARAGHPSLATVLRTDREAGEIWLEAPRGRPLSQGIALTPMQIESLREALQALHRAGGRHGFVDRDHVFVTETMVLLAFPREVVDGGADDDERLLRELLA
jgi:eukaryotic-like serine/threonine-protein kinase